LCRVCGLSHAAGAESITRCKRRSALTLRKVTAAAAAAASAAAAAVAKHFVAVVPSQLHKRAANERRDMLD